MTRTAQALDRPVEVEFPNEYAVGVERRQSEDRHARIGQWGQECHEYAGQPEVEGTTDREGSPPALAANVAGDVRFRADYR